MCENVEFTYEQQMSCVVDPHVLNSKAHLKKRQSQITFVIHM